MTEVKEDWTKWRKTLARGVGIGKMVGMEEETIIKTADKIGDFLENKIDPGNPEQKILQELWKVGTEKEQHALASMLVKLVQAKEN